MEDRSAENRRAPAYPGQRRRDCCSCTNVVQDNEGNVVSGLTDQILGGDDEWYCRSCEPRFYYACDTKYNGGGL